MQGSQCAQSAAQHLGATSVVYGMVRPLGSKILITVTLVEGQTGRTLMSQSMSVDRVEDLDIAAKRLARSLATGEPVGETAQLGTVTHQEEKPPVRRGLNSDTSLRLGAIVPLSNSGYGGLGTGLAADLGMWLEAYSFALEPRMGVRFDTRSSDKGGYFEFPIDLGVYYVLGAGDVAPIVGGGVGLHYLHESRREQITLSNYVISQSTGYRKDGGWGFAAFGRVGLLLFRTYKARVLLSADYNATFVELNGGNVAQSVVFGVSFIL